MTGRKAVGIGDVDLSDVRNGQCSRWSSFQGKLSSSSYGTENVTSLQRTSEDEKSFVAKVKLQMMSRQKMVKF